MVITWISAIGLALTAAALLYWYTLVLGALLPAKRPTDAHPATRFAVAIPAHNEQEVIASTIRAIHAADYPPGWVRVYVAADFCSDATAEQARAAGALVFERSNGARGGKGEALRWLFDQILGQPDQPDALLILDADSRIDAAFFRVMNRYLQAGAQAVQGNHIIANQGDSWFAALIWAMFLIDNRFQNQGRTAFRFSAKNMGDAICFRRAVIEQHGWGAGLTEDYAFRQALLLNNIRIVYAADAKSYGQAAWNWQMAQRQRLRWLRGAQSASRASRAALWRVGWLRRSPAILEGALQTVLPSYSSLTVVAAAAWLAHLILIWLAPGLLPLPLFTGWSILLALLFLYPWIGLALEKAPLRAYQAVMMGPAFVVWRTWLRVQAGLGRQQITWTRTPHRRQE